MAYAMFECPKLHNARSLKFYPEDYNHHVSFRHKALPPDLDLNLKNYWENNVHAGKQNCSIDAQSSSYRKCPIYVHSYEQNGDFVIRNNQNKHKSKRLVLQKLEETYWANWKPGKNEVKSEIPVLKKIKQPEVHVIKSAPDRRRKFRVYPRLSEAVPKKVSNKSQEIQTEEPTPPIPAKKDSSKTVHTEIVVEEEEKKFLKHTDSLILNTKKRNTEKERFDQPTCIRLYRKPGKLGSKNFVKGGSYPLKSCLKKDNNKTNVRQTRPGSPVIVSNSFSSKSKHGKHHRH